LAHSNYFVRSITIKKDVWGRDAEEKNRDNIVKGKVKPKRRRGKEFFLGRGTIESSKLSYCSGA